MSTRPRGSRPLNEPNQDRSALPSASEFGGGEDISGLQDGPILALPSADRNDREGLRGGIEVPLVASSLRIASRGGLTG